MPLIPFFCKIPLSNNFNIKFGDVSTFNTDDTLIFGADTDLSIAS